MLFIYHKFTRYLTLTSVISTSTYMMTTPVYVSLCSKQNISHTLNTFIFTFNVSNYTYICMIKISVLCITILG